MSIESKGVTGPNPTAAEVTESRAPQSTKRSRLPRWVRVGTPIAILAIGTAVEAFIWNKYEGDGTFQVMLTWYTVPIFVLGLLIWWTFLSGLRWSTRLAGLGLLAVAGIAFGFTFRLKEFTGDMVPHFQVRWQRSAEQRAADYWKNEKSEVATAATASGKAGEAVVEKLEIGPQDWSQFNGPRRDGRADSVRIRTSWQEEKPRKLADMDQHPPRELWRHPVGAAWSSFRLWAILPLRRNSAGPTRRSFVTTRKMANRSGRTSTGISATIRRWRESGPARRPRFTTRGCIPSVPREF
jgi:hypothetical protein